MEIVVEIKTTASHSKEYQEFELVNWDYYQIKQYQEGDTLPADSEFLAILEDNLIFKVLRPKPRSLPILDRVVSTKVSLFFHPKTVTLSKLVVELKKFLQENIFVTKAESEWWNKYRELHVSLGEKLTIVTITGKN